MNSLEQDVDAIEGGVADHRRLPQRALVLSENLRHAERIRACIRSFGDVAVELAPLKAGFDSAAVHSSELLVLDIEDVGVDPLFCIKQIKGIAPLASILVISSVHNLDLASRILRAGASAYLTAEEVDAWLQDAIGRVTSGERFVSDDVMQGILRGMVESGSGERRLPIEVLSDREMVVFQLIGHGRTFREIADELGVNIKTVATHCNNIRRKLHSRNNRHLTRLSRNWVAERNPGGAVH